MPANLMPANPDINDINTTDFVTDAPTLPMYFIFICTKIRSSIIIYILRNEEEFFLMPGENYIKVSSVLFVVGAVLSIIIYPFAGLSLGYAAAITGKSLGWLFVVACVFYTILAILQLIASVKGIRGCCEKEEAADLKKWGKILILFSLVSSVFGVAQSILNDQSLVYSILGLLFGLVFPGLYIYGASLNEKYEEGWV